MGYLIAAYVVVFAAVAGYTAWIHRERAAAARETRRAETSGSERTP